MNWAHFHLITNHFPVIGAIFGTLVLLWGLARKDSSISSVGLVLMVFTGLIAIPVFLTGEPAEEIVEDLPGVLHNLIESHEDFAKFALGSAIVSGIAALGTLIFSIMKPENSLLKFLMLGTLALSAITLGTMSWTGKLGGEIRHSEIRTASAQTTPAATETKRGKEDDDDH